MPSIEYVLSRGGFHTVSDEETVSTMLRSADFSKVPGLGVAGRGFEKRIINLGQLSVNDLARICEAAGKKLVIQIED